MKLIKGEPGKHSHIISPDEMVDEDDDVSADQFPYENTLCSPPGSQTDNTLRLFNLTADPSERNDLILEHPEVAKRLLEKLSGYEATMIPPNLEPGNELGNPNRFGGVWGPGWCQSQP